MDSITPLHNEIAEWLGKNLDAIFERVGFYSHIFDQIMKAPDEYRTIPYGLRLIEGRINQARYQVPILDKNTSIVGYTDIAAVIDLDCKHPSRLIRAAGASSKDETNQLR